MGWILVGAIVSIPLFYCLDNKQLTKEDLSTVNNLILSKDAEFNPGGGKASAPSILFSFTSSDRSFQLVYEEYQCVSNSDILTNFKKGDTVSISVSKSDIEKIYHSNWFDSHSKIYGLLKNGESYVSLDCRNQVSHKRAFAATIASILSAVLSTSFLAFFLTRKTKHQAYGSFPINPVFVIILTWAITYLLLR